MKNQTQAILIVEDNDDDYESTYDALTENGNLINPIYRCKNGKEALDFLYHEGHYHDPKTSPLPGLVLLDLNMPGIDGRAVLSRMRQDPELHRIPVIVFTTSGDPMDINACYDAGANSYIQKPVNLEKLIEAIQRLREYWFEICVLPKE